MTAFLKQQPNEKKTISRGKIFCCHLLLEDTFYNHTKATDDLLYGILVLLVVVVGVGGGGEEEG
jgi:hypothetical protein